MAYLPPLEIVLSNDSYNLRDTNTKLHQCFHLQKNLSVLILDFSNIYIPIEMSTDLESKSPIKQNNVSIINKLPLIFVEYEAVFTCMIKILKKYNLK